MCETSGETSSALNLPPNCRKEGVKTSSTFNCVPLTKNLALKSLRIITTRSNQAFLNRSLLGQMIPQVLHWTMLSRLSRRIKPGPKTKAKTSYSLLLILESTEHGLNSRHQD